MARTAAYGQNSCNASAAKQDRGQSIASSREGIFTPSYKFTFALGENRCKCFTWARTAANASVDRRQSIAEGIFTPSYELESEQLVALGENSCKCFMWASTMRGRSAVSFFSAKEQKISFLKMNET